MNEDGPSIWGRLGVALGLAIGSAALLVALVGKPTWGVRAGALGIVALVAILVVVWHWGFSRGFRSAAESRQRTSASGLGREDRR